MLFKKQNDFADVMEIMSWKAIIGDCSIYNFFYPYFLIFFNMFFSIYFNIGSYLSYF